MDIVIIGAGNIGRRHLEGVLASHLAEKIHIVDPDQTSRDSARAIIASASTVVMASYSRSLSDLPEVADLVIDATRADGRRQRLEVVMARTKTQTMLVEKVVFQNIEDFDFIGSAARARGIDIRVNFPRRLAPVHQRIAALLAEARRSIPGLPLSMSITGGGWSLACNAVHFLDLYLMMAGPEETFGPWMSEFAEGMVESKRAGAIEVYGTLAVSGSVGTLIMTCDKEPSPIQIDISSGHNRIIVRETLHMLMTSGAEWTIEDAPVPLVSAATEQIVRSIHGGAPTAVPPLSVARTGHAPLLAAIRAHLTASGIDVIRDVPIT